MRKYFGTDGIRKIANTELTPSLAYRVAKAGAYVLTKKNNKAPTIIIGRDTRISGNLIESAMVSGFLSYGANVKLLGVIPTPAVAYLTKKLNADAGIVISASHNSYEFNGIKFFSNKGMKISDEIEEEIEAIMDSEDLDKLSAPYDKIGTYENIENVSESYVEFIYNLFKDKFIKFSTNNLKIVIDTANGATYNIAERIYKKFGFKFKVIHNNPNGVNINDKCGSTSLDSLKKYVVENGFDIGIAFDGDGDRCLLVDEKGNIIDGDIILAIISKYMMNNNMLKNNTLVATIMSNLGLNKYASENGINLVQTTVGDRYVLEEMLKNSYNLGGEQSGHVICLDYNPTGDGILTSLMVLVTLLSNNISLSKAASIIKKYPQVTVNARIDSNKKQEFKNNSEILDKVDNLKKKYESLGRVVIRVSGTEPLIRVMIEGKDIEKMTEDATELAKFIEEKLK